MLLKFCYVFRDETVLGLAYIVQVIRSSRNIMKQARYAIVPILCVCLTFIFYAPHSFCLKTMSCGQGRLTCFTSRTYRILIIPLLNGKTQ